MTKKIRTAYFGITVIWALDCMFHLVNTCLCANCGDHTSIHISMCGEYEIIILNTETSFLVVFCFVQYGFRARLFTRVRPSFFTELNAESAQKALRALLGHMDVLQFS